MYSLSMKTRHCRNCDSDKSLDKFVKNTKKKYGRGYECKKCHGRHYAKRRKHYVALAKKRVNEYRRKMYVFLFNYLKSNPCVDCGEHDPVILEFDHVRGTKVRSISQMVHHCFSYERLQVELKKCEVRCANCHRRRTAKGYSLKNLTYMPTQVEIPRRSAKIHGL
jgi:hypothetical protein